MQKVTMLKRFLSSEGGLIFYSSHNVDLDIYFTQNLTYIIYGEFDQLGSKTSQELGMLSSVTINCQITKIVLNSGSQLSEL